MENSLFNKVNSSTLSKKSSILCLVGASIKIGPGKMGKDILNKTGKRGILDIVTGCLESDKTREEVIERWAAKEK